MAKELVEKRAGESTAVSNENKDTSPRSRAPTGSAFYQVLREYQLRVTPDVPKKEATTRLSTPLQKRKDTLGGRFTLGGFVNPDTRSAKHAAAQQAAAADAAQRRAHVLESRRSEYDSCRDAHGARGYFTAATTGGREAQCSPQGAPQVIIV